MTDAWTAPIDTIGVDAYEMRLTRSASGSGAGGTVLARLETSDDRVTWQDCGAALGLGGPGRATTLLRRDILRYGRFVRVGLATTAGVDCAGFALRPVRLDRPLSPGEERPCRSP